MASEVDAIPSTQRRRFELGDPVLLVDRRRRRYLLFLAEGGSFHTHMGVIPHVDVVGQEFGARLRTTLGHTLLAFYPTLGDFVHEMHHSTQVVYPKDMGAILMYGDIFPGARVLEAGVGSGALTMALLRAVGQTGSVTTYELRPEFVAKAWANIRVMLPDVSNLEIRVADVYSHIDETDLDRIVLDVPEPWHVVPLAADALVPGGILTSYLPTVLQVHELHETIRENGRFELAETIEVLVRPWSVSRRSVRPEHRMVGHTGFITTARRCDPDSRDTETGEDAEPAETGPGD